MPKVTPRFKPLSRTFLRQWQQSAGLSQEAAAERIGVHRSRLSKIENGKAPYNQSFLEASANAYRCEVVDLLIRNPSDKSAVWSIVAALDKAPKPEREKIISALQILLKTAS